MRNLGSYLIILIFLTAYGRCVADQFGMLHSSETSCCVSVCDTADHCPDEDDQSSPNPDAPEQPAPCQLCFILDSDGVMIEDGFKTPTPNLLEVFDFLSFRASLEDILRGRLLIFSKEPSHSKHRYLSLDQRSHLLRIAAKAHPVRGPSLA